MTLSIRVNYFPFKDLWLSINLTDLDLKKLVINRMNIIHFVCRTHMTFVDKSKTLTYLWKTKLKCVIAPKRYRLHTRRRTLKWYQLAVHLKFVLLQLTRVNQIDGNIEGNPKNIQLKFLDCVCEIRSFIETNYPFFFLLITVELGKHKDFIYVTIKIFLVKIQISIQLMTLVLLFKN